MSARLPIRPWLVYVVTACSWYASVGCLGVQHSESVHTCDQCAMYGEHIRTLAACDEMQRLQHTAGEEHDDLFLAIRVLCSGYGKGATRDWAARYLEDSLLPLSVPYILWAMRQYEGGSFGVVPVARRILLSDRVAANTEQHVLLLHGLVGLLRTADDWATRSIVVSVLEEYSGKQFGRFRVGNVRTTYRDSTIVGKWERFVAEAYPAPSGLQ